MNVLEYVRNQTKEFLDNMPKSVRKKKGQFFTSLETAAFMAEMFDFSNCGEEVSILDPGAGTGILTVAFVDRLLKEKSDIRVRITCYETDTEVLPVLKKNLEYLKNSFKESLTYRILEEDYILSQSNDFQENLLASKNPKKYDYVIGNPPYLRVMRDNPSAIAMPKVVHGAPNLYFLFASMSLYNLKNNAEMVYIIPRSWTSGAYFKAFREYFLNVGKIESIHLFVSRDKVFNAEQVLQETMIIKVRKTAKKPENVLTSEPMTPEYLEIEKDYYLSRKTENSWSDEEINKMFGE